MQIETRLLKLADQIRTLKRRDEKNLFLYNSVVYSASLIKRFQMAIDLPTEFYAWITRDLFELSLLIRYVLISPDNLRKFAAELAVDEIEMLQGMREIVQPEQVELKEAIENRIKQVQEILAKHQMIPSKPIPVARLAKATNMEKEYRAFFKLYSKYVHPSCWLLMGSRERIHSPWIRDTFLIQAQYYTGIISKVVSDATGIEV